MKIERVAEIFIKFRSSRRGPVHIWQLKENPKLEKNLNLIHMSWHHEFLKEKNKNVLAF